MSAIRATGPVLPLPTPYNNFPPQVWDGGTADFVAHWGRSGAVISVRGEIDAANVEQFANHLERFLNCGDWLVLDLTELEFIGTAGFSALVNINSRCARDAMAWALVPGSAVSRLLRICDPDCRLPIADSVTVALAALQDPQRLLHLVSQPGQ